MKKYSLILIGVVVLIIIMVFPSCYMKWMIKKDAAVIGEQKLENEKLLFPDVENQIYSSLLMINEMLDSKVEETQMVGEAECEQYIEDTLAQWNYLFRNGLCPAAPFDMQNESVSYSVVKKSYEETVFHKYTCEVMEISMENDRAAFRALYDSRDGVYYLVCIQEKEEKKNEAYMQKIQSGIDANEGLEILFGQKGKVVSVEMTEMGELMEEEPGLSIDQEIRITLQQNGKNNFLLQSEQEGIDVFFKGELQDKMATYQLYVE